MSKSTINPSCGSHHEFMALYQAGWKYEEERKNSFLVRPSDGKRLKVSRLHVKRAADHMIPCGFEKVHVGADPLEWRECLELWKPIRRAVDSWGTLWLSREEMREIYP